MINGMLVTRSKPYYRTPQHQSLTK